MRKEANGFFLFLQKFRSVLELDETLNVFSFSWDLVEWKSKEFSFNTSERIIPEPSRTTTVDTAGAGFRGGLEYTEGQIVSEW